MAIDNVVSTLPDPEYVAALEKKINWLESQFQKMSADVSNLNRGLR